jgi:hypothetical protein
MMVLWHQRLLLCLRNNINSVSGQKSSDDGVLALLIFPCSCDDNAGSGNTVDGALALLAIPCSYNDGGGIRADNNALALLIVPHSCK